MAESALVWFYWIKLQLISIIAFGWNNPFLVVVVAMVGFIVGVGVYLDREKKRQGLQQAGDFMFSMQREKYLRELMADGIEAMFDTFLEDGKCYPREAVEMKRRIANLVELKDLLPMGQLTLKERLRAKFKPTIIPPVEVEVTIKKKKDMQGIFS